MSRKNKNRLQIPKDKLRKLKKPRAIHKPEQSHQDKRITYNENRKRINNEIQDALDEYYEDIN